LYAEEGDVLEIFKIGEKVKITLQKIKNLEYLTDITPNTFY
jgi:bifunctional DNA-binding transcriptional regulator/antitoxin component of YhaV-PrlF toxin-antitoxin module